MKKQIQQIAFIYLSLHWGSTVAQAQGTFQNLNFESANVSGYPVGSYTVPITSALPGWTGTYSSTQFGTNQTSQVGYDVISLGGPIITLVDGNVAQYGLGPLQGTFSAALLSAGLSGQVASAISQTGLVPGGTMSLQAQMDVHGPNPVVMLGGQVINMIPLASFPTYVLYGGDISSFAGQVATLSFAEPPPGAQVSLSSLLLDNIAFSPQTVPEPNTIGLVGLGSLLVASRALKRR
jgi:hypothetical protein